MRRLVPLLLAALFLAGCAINFKPVVKKDVAENARPRINASILVDVSDEFDKFIYVADYGVLGSTSDVLFGDGVRDIFPNYLKNIFTSVPYNIPGKSPGSYDFISSPRFINTRFATGQKLTIETTVEILFVSEDKSTFVRLAGSGKDDGMYRDGYFHEDFGTAALTQALVNLRDEIYRNEALFR